MLLKSVYGIHCLNFKLSTFTQGFYVASSSSSKLRRGPSIGFMFFGRKITQVQSLYILKNCVKVKVKQSHYRSGVAQRIPGS